MRTLQRIRGLISGKLDSIPRRSVGAMTSALLILGVAMLTEAVCAQSNETLAKTPLSPASAHVQKQSNEPEIDDPFANSVDFLKIEWVDSGISPAAMAKARWKRLIPQVRAYRDQRQLALKQITAKVEQILRELQSEIKFESYVEDVQSITTSVKYVVDSERLIESLVARFEREIFSEELIQKLFNEAASLLHVSLTEIDDAGLVAMEIDTTLDSGTLPQARMQIRIPSVSTNGLADDLSNHLIEIIKQKVASTAASIAAGAVVEQAFSSQFAYDKYGNYNVFGGLFSMAAGLAAGAVADTVVSEAMDIEHQLRATLSRGLADIYAKLTSSQAEWRRSLSTLSLSHDRAFIESIILSIGVDRDWAESQLE